MSSPALHWALQIPGRLGCFNLLLGGMGMLGWVLGEPRLLTFVPGGAPIVFNAALLIAGLGLGLGALDRGFLLVARAAGVGVAGLGTVTLAQFLVGRDLGVDELFWRHDLAVAMSSPGRMAPNTAFAGLVGGIGVVLATVNLGRKIAAVLAAVVMTVGLLALAGHAFQLTSALNWRDFTGMALPTALGLVTAGVGLQRQLERTLQPEEKAGLRATILLGVAGASVVVVGAAAIMSNRTQAESVRRVTVSESVIASVNYLELCVTRLESSSRAFVATHDSQFREFYADILPRTYAELAKFNGLVAGVPTQRENARQLGELVQRKITFMQESLLRDRRSPTEAARLIAAGGGAELMAAIREQINVIERAERLVLDQRVQETTRLAEQTNRVILLGNVMALGFLGWAVTVNRRTDRARRRAERALLEANQLQQAVLDGTVHSVIGTDFDGTIRMFNTGAEKMLGYRRDEVVNRATPALIHDPVEVAARAAEMSAELGQPVAPGFEVFVARARKDQLEEREWSYVRKDGSRLPVSLSVTVLRDAAGEPTGFLGVATDLSERKAAEAKIRASEERFRQAFEYAGIGMALVGLDGSWLRVNAAVCAIVGYDEATLLTKTFQEITYPEDLKMDLDSVADLMVGRSQRFQMEKRYIHQAGHLVWVRLTVSLVRSAAGTPEHFISQIEDIDRQKRMMQQLAESQEQLSNVFAAMAEGLVLHDAEGGVVECNASACRILGLSREEMMSRLVSDRSWRTVRRDGQPFPLEDYPVMVTLRTGRGCSNVDMGVRRPDGLVTWISINTEPLHDAQGRVRRVVVSFTDVTERRNLLESLAEARDRALEASRLKSEFLASMSHEIRTPMNGIIGMSALLMDTPVNAEQREMAAVIQNSAESLLTIINDILDFSKIEAGKMRLSPGTVELAGLFEESLALLAPRAHDKQLELVNDFDPRLALLVQADAGRLRQVLLNLVGNAIKFTERGEVVVATRWRRERDGRVGMRCEVRDTGIGIAREAQRLLFEPFVQADGSTTRRFGGTGLGLAISRQLVELMGGKIGFESEAGRGSTFWFELELAATPGVARLPELRVDGLKVLVVDDHELGGQVVGGQLARLGVDVEVVRSGAVALDELRRAAHAGAPFTLGVIDGQMPGLSGAELAQAIRADERLAALPLILLAGANPQLDPAEVERWNFAAVLNKPVRLAQLHRALLLGVGQTQPVRDPAQVSAPAPARELPLLLAEDNPTNQLVALKLLEKIGYRADVARNGREALALLKERRYAAVLMDCQMPEMDGYTATQRIRSGAESGVDPRVPIIALTAYALPSDRQKCLEAGMDDYVAKPLRAEELQRALRQCGLLANLKPAPLPGVAASVNPPDAVAVGPELDARQLRELRSLPGIKYPTLWQDLQEIFLEQTPPLLVALQAAVAQADAAEVNLLCHRLAGSCANLGAVKLRAAAHALEHASHPVAHVATWPELLNTLDQEWSLVRTQLSTVEPRANP